jgi:hypothetical protein
MIKSPYIIICLLIILSFGCKKADKPTPYYDPNTGDLQYSVIGLHDTFVEQSGTVTIPLYVNRAIGTPEDVRLSIASLPAGVRGYLTPSVGTPSFNTLLTFETNRAATGNYSVTLIGVSNTSGLKNFDMMLRVVPYSDPSLALEGSFKETRACSQTGSGDNTVTMTAIKGQIHKIKMTGIWVGGSAYSVTVDANPVNHVLTIAPQVQNSLTISGSGTYTDENSFTITYSVTGNLVNDNCTSNFDRL